jgi:hypothetical protein
MTLEEPRQAARAGGHACLGQPVAQLVQDDLRLRLVTGQDQTGVGLDAVRAVVAARWLGRDLPLPPEPGRPAARAGHADPKARRSLMAGRPIQHRSHDTLTEIDGQR